MPFIDFTVAGEPLAPAQVAALQEGITGLTDDILKKKAQLTAVLVEEAVLVGWVIGGHAVAVLGAELPLATSVVIHELARESWGYGGLTQEQRAQALVRS